MAVQKKKVSKTRTHRRHSTWETRKLKKITNKLNIVKCPNCGEEILAHRVCPSCGYYKGEQIITIKVKSKEKVVEA